MTLDLEALAVARADEQLDSGAWRLESSAASGPSGRQRCADCGRPIAAQEKQAGPTCSACKKKARRQTCWACGDRAVVRGYCRRHWDHLQSSGVVDPLHIGKDDGAGSPRGWRAGRGA